MTHTGYKVADGLVISDTLPDGAHYAGSSDGGALAGNAVQLALPSLAWWEEASASVHFAVTATQMINQRGNMMKVRLFLILAVLFCSCMSGCKTVRYMKDISQVSYTSESGTILPELQWYEQIIITRNKVTLARNGKAANTEVNAGTWEFAVDEQKVTAFFEHLEAVDCSSIKKVEPDEPTVGGGTETYSIVYAGDKTFCLRYGQGTTHTDGMLIVKPIDAFIESLALPADAANQYKFSTDQP